MLNVNKLMTSKVALLVIFVNFDVRYSGSELENLFFVQKIQPVK